MYFGCFAVIVAMLGITLVFPPPVLFQMCIYSTCAIYVGCHLSLGLLSSTGKDGEEKEVETVSQTDAMMFPVFGSCALFSLYVAFKWFGPYYVNLLLTTYLSIAGVAALGETLMPLLTPCFAQKIQDKKFDINIDIPSKPWPISQLSDEPLEVKFTMIHVVAYCISATFAAVFWITKNWMLHNVFGVSFCVQAISLVHIPTFKIAFILLAGLFIYDIFWVFGSDVMVTVAKSFDAPAKLIFPISLNPWKQSILGLGDIVVPGIVMSMCLRYDATKAFKEADYQSTDIFKSFPKTYFYSVLVWYNAGLLTTGLVMFYFNHAQPALLYLCPAVSLSIITTAFFKGEFSKVMSYDESELLEKNKKVDGGDSGSGPKAAEVKKDK